MILLKKPLVIVANGEFPKHSSPLQKIKNAQSIVACDGGVNNLVKIGYSPNLIIGDLDSISKKNKEKYKNITIEIQDQSDNDLRKAINHCIQNRIDKLSIIAASGKREDHTIGNIFSLLNYTNIDIELLTDTGIFKCISGNQKISSFKGQKISFFSTDNTIKITSNNLKYNFKEDSITSIFYGTLNESLNNVFNINISHGNILIYQSYR